MNPSRRQLLIKQLFGGPIPSLWCPPLTFFSQQGEFDARQIEKHLTTLPPYVGGLLIPGSTGEGWQMSDQEIAKLLKISLHIAYGLGIKVLIGILKTDADSVLRAIDLLGSTLSAKGCVGITVCPPKGKDLDQSQVARSLYRVLSMNIPTALYQLPQVTENEMTADTVAELANAFPNFYMFKDTSGKDRVAMSGRDFGGVFLVRGSEQNGYAKWTRRAGGPYDGFLLSTANVFAPELSRMIRLQQDGQAAAAEELSDRLERLVAEAFQLVAKHPDGNPFTNANKLLLAVRRFGKQASKQLPPMLYSGNRLPPELLDTFIGLIDQHPWLDQST